MTNLTGQDIGRYRIIEPLGQGGMATVYRAYDTHLECEVAVKFIRMEQLPPVEVERTLKRFEREAKEVARLTHPNIVKVTDYGEYKGTPYLVMVYLSGGTLKQLAGEPLPYDQAARLLAPVARALEYAHEKNLIHRDIKPGNILLTDKGQPMVSDFGIAKILGVEGGNTLTSTNVAIGTPEYMAPEQWFNQISAQSDIYSLGVVFYELVTGRKPYTADTPAAIFLKQSTDPLPRPRSFVPGLPEEVEKVLYKALARKPEERYASMGEFAAALEGLAGLVKPAQPPRAEVFETVSARPEAPAAAPKPQESEVLQTEETGLEIPGSPSAGTGGSPPPESDIIPVSLPVKTPSARPFVIGWKWVTVGVIVLVGLVALVGWGVGKYTFSMAITQTAQALTMLSQTGTPVLPIPTISVVLIQTETSAAKSVPTPGIGSTQVSPKDGMVMIYIPAGEFLMGSDKTKDSQADYNELPQHKVYLDAYWIDVTVVTNAMFTAFFQASGYKTDAEKAGWAYVFVSKNGSWNQVNGADWRHPKGPQSNLQSLEKHPVVQVSWNDAQAYCQWSGRRLPSEAEWEKAARGVDGRIYPWGDAAPDPNKLNYNGVIGDTTAVGSYPSGASSYGALDMAGNVSDWVNDWYSDTYYQQSPSINPIGPTSGTYRVLRGGSWYGSGRNARSAYRSWDTPDIRYGIIGFRCAASH
jgi:formylglycine-generating enzyme required for sulfatase activity/tRNA A-37 threonylcarbamoyl transferase component Bud32